MVSLATEIGANEVADAIDGIELKEVDFKEFDRRKAPRMSNYESFVKSLESSFVEIEFIV
jgi:hypothetical protein